MSSTKRPWYSFYPRDYLADTVHLTLEEDGAYRRLLDWAWLQDAPVPSDPVELARVLRVPVPKAKRLWTALAGYFPRGRNGRLERERKEAAGRSVKAREAAEEGWRQRRERDANASLEHMPEQSERNANASAEHAPSICSDDAIHRHKHKHRTNSLSESPKTGTAEPIGAILHRIAKGAA